MTMSSFAPGTLIGEARIVRQIGEGRLATVYEVIWRGQRCAMKIADGTIDSTTLPGRIAQEGEAFAMIEHLNVVRWLDTGVYEGRVWLVLELVEDGKTIRQVMCEAGGRLSCERVVTLARQACEGLAALHKKGIVHRDVNPGTILVARGDIAKIGDLFSVKMPKWGVKTTKAYPLMSMRYSPPESWAAGGVEPAAACDVYQMGVTIYEMITGANPIAPVSTDLVTLRSRILDYEVPPLSSVAEVHVNLSSIVAQAMAKDPAQRPTMRQLAEKLEEIQDELLAWRRSAARSVPLPNRERGLQNTVPLRVRKNLDEEESPKPDEKPSKPEEPSRRGPRGTVAMPVTASSPVAPTAPSPATQAGREDTERCGPPTFGAPTPPCGSGIAAGGQGRDTDRAAALPPEVPSTLRVLSRPRPSAPELAPPSLASKPSEFDDVRRSTGIPVESAARPSLTSPRRRAVHVLVGGVLLVVLAVVGWWTLFQGGGGQPPKPALPPPPPPLPPVTATATTGPKLPASAVRPPARPPVSPRR
jgi:serine/threonine-protein kinase